MATKVITLTGTPSRRAPRNRADGRFGPFSAFRARRRRARLDWRAQMEVGRETGARC
jgi:hypothetical protein